MIISKQKFLASIFSFLILLHISLMLILTRGGAHISFFGIYISEWILLPSFLLIANSKNKILKQDSILYIILFFYLYSIFSALIAYFNGGTIVNIARNSAWFWYIPNLALGFFLRDQLTTGRFKSWIIISSFFLFIALLYHPFRSNFSDGSDSIFGWYSSIYIAITSFSFWIILRDKKLFPFMLACINIMIEFLYIQSRAAIIIFLLFFLVIWPAYKFKNFFRFFKMTFIITLILIPIVKLFHGTRVNLDLNSFSLLFKSIIPGSTVNPSLEGGVQDRLLWWQESLSTYIYGFDMHKILFGIGLDKVLVTNGIGNGFIIRFPHNGYITILVLLGIVGFSLSILLMAFALKISIEMKKSSNKLNNDIACFGLIFILAFLVSSLTGVVIETPYYAGVFWILFGLLAKSYFDEKSTWLHK